MRTEANMTNDQITERNKELFNTMYESASRAVVFWLSLGYAPSEAIAKARRESCAGSLVWERITVRPSENYPWELSYVPRKDGYGAEPGSCQYSPNEASSAGGVSQT